jgi:hypothetical protein
MAHESEVIHVDPGTDLDRLLEDVGSNSIVLERRAFAIVSNVNLSPSLMTTTSGPTTIQNKPSPQSGRWQAPGAISTPKL